MELNLFIAFSSQLFQGTYLDSQNKICLLCSYCKKGEVVKEECAIWADTECGKVQATTQVLPTQKLDPVVRSVTTQVAQPGLPTSTEPKSQKGTSLTCLYRAVFNRVP